MVLILNNSVDGSITKFIKIHYTFIKLFSLVCSKLNVSSFYNYSYLLQILKENNITSELNTLYTDNNYFSNACNLTDELKFKYMEYKRCKIDHININDNLLTFLITTLENIRKKININLIIFYKKLCKLVNLSLIHI